ncbi:amino acid adenylation domain-containing protein, partial [Paraburkholderia sp. JPY454]|nr:amino acid adenylation domain-containing protein [Paraburkholderia youngii]
MSNETSPLQWVISEEGGRRRAARSSVCSVFVGGGTLAIRCAELAMEMGHFIGAVLCGDGIFADWAARSDIRCVSSVQELGSFLKVEPVDWIFSVGNPYILPKDVFGRARQGAFNYHDGPLPRYAGVHATSWALLAHESEHAISWHHIDDGIDTGDLVIQRKIPIAPTDSALTLNLKCDEAAIKGFQELLAGLKFGGLIACPQTQGDRSYFSKFRRPDAAGCLRWDRTAQDLLAITRALDFGAYEPNPLGLPKIVIRDEMVLVERLAVLPVRSGVPAGSLLEIKAKHWRIATGTQDVDVWFRDLNDGVLDARLLAKNLELHEGDRLTVLTRDEVRSITAVHQSLAHSEDFWRRRLEKFKPLQVLPLSSPSVEMASPQWQSSSWITSSVLIDLPTIDRVEYLLTAWLIYLARITGENTFQLGWSRAPDGLQAGSKVIDMLVASVVPMEVCIDLFSDFAEVRRAVRAECALLTEHNSYARDIVPRNPTLRGVQALRLQRPWQIGTRVTVGECGSAKAGSRRSSQTAGVALCGELLTFEIDALDGTFRWHFDVARIAPQQVDRMAQHLEILLREAVAKRQQPVCHLDLLPAAERRYLLEELNRTEAAYPSERCIHELFEAQVRRAPEAVALVHENERLSYGELNARANRLAHHLVGLGVRPDQPVAICVERSAAMVVGLLAILKAGGAYLPLDPAYPSQRLRQVLGDAAPQLLLCDAAGRAALGPEVLTDVIAVDLETATPVWGEQPPSDPEPRTLGLTSRHLAYVIYTSGSTGTPKGVQNEHRAVINRLIWMQKAYALNTADVVLQKTPFSVDVSAWEFFWTLLEGATLVLAVPGVHKDPDALVNLIIGQRITTAHFVPSMLAGFMDTKGVDRCTSLQRLVCSGEALSASLTQKVRCVLPWTGLHNLYGPTEAAIDVTAWNCPADFNGSVVPIGRPIANTRVYLLDGHGAPVPFGAVGELYIGGAGVARGYLNRPELTAERFITSPFVEGDRLYRTGDLGRYLPDGNLEFLGRNDDQVKIRGYRIEPGEIAARLGEHAFVREAVVVARQNRAGDKHLIAYVVCAPEAQSDGLDGPDLANTLRAHLSARLPDYMVPSAFMRLSELPLTVNGKLDRKALPAPADDAYARRGYEAPRGELETVLAQLWAELLGLERVGRHDHFFELGGHSLLAVRLLSRLSQIAGVELSLAMLFARPVLGDLAANIVEVLSRSGPQHLPAIVAVSRQAPLELSFAQQRLWFLAQLDKDSARYHVPLGWRLQGRLDRAAWRRSLDQLYARHEALRSVFVDAEEGPRVEILPPGT